MERDTLVKFRFAQSVLGGAGDFSAGSVSFFPQNTEATCFYNLILRPARLKLDPPKGKYGVHTPYSMV